MSDLHDRIREAVQAVLDAEENQGWTVAQWVVAMGLERIVSDGTMESCSWLMGPPDQAYWMTTGLLEAAFDLHGSAEVDE